MTKKLEVEVSYVGERDDETRKNKLVVEIKKVNTPEDFWGAMTRGTGKSTNEWLEPTTEIENNWGRRTGREISTIYIFGGMRELKQHCSKTNLGGLDGVVVDGIEFIGEELKLLQRFYVSIRRYYSSSKEKRISLEPSGRNTKRGRDLAQNKSSTVLLNFSQNGFRPTQKALKELPSIGALPVVVTVPLDLVDIFVDEIAKGKPGATSEARRNLLIAALVKWNVIRVLKTMSGGDRITRVVSSFGGAEGSAQHVQRRYLITNHREQFPNTRFLVLNS